MQEKLEVSVRPRCSNAKQPKVQNRLTYLPDPPPPQQVCLQWHCFYQPQAVSNFGVACCSSSEDRCLLNWIIVVFAVAWGLLIPGDPSYMGTPLIPGDPSYLGIPHTLGPLLPGDSSHLGTSHTWGPLIPGDLSYLSSYAYHCCCCCCWTWGDVCLS